MDFPVLPPLPSCQKRFLAIVLALALVVLTVPESAMVTYGEEVQVTEATEATDAEVDVDTAASGEVEVVADDAVAIPTDEVAADVDAEAEASDAVVEDAEAVETDAETTVDADAETDTAAEKGAEVETDVVEEKGDLAATYDVALVLIKGESTSDPEVLEKATSASANDKIFSIVTTNDEGIIGLPDAKKLTELDWQGGGSVVKVTPSSDKQTAVFEALTAGSATITFNYTYSTTGLKYEIDYHVVVLDMTMTSAPLPQDEDGNFLATLNHVNALKTDGSIGYDSNIEYATQNDTRFFNVTNGSTEVDAFWTAYNQATVAASASGNTYISVSTNNRFTSGAAGTANSQMPVTAQKSTDGADGKAAALTAEYTFPDPYNTTNNAKITRTLTTLVTVVEHATGIQPVKTATDTTATKTDKTIKMSVGDSKTFSVKELSGVDLTGRTITLGVSVTGNGADEKTENANVVVTEGTGKNTEITGGLDGSNQITFTATTSTKDWKTGKYKKNNQDVKLAITAYEKIQIGETEQSIPVGYIERVLDIQDVAGIIPSKQIVGFNVFQAISGNSETVTINNPTFTDIYWHSSDESLVKVEFPTGTTASANEEVTIKPVEKVGKAGSVKVFATTDEDDDDYETAKKVAEITVNIYGITANGGNLKEVDPKATKAEINFVLDLAIQADQDGYVGNGSGGLKGSTVSEGWSNGTITFNDFTTVVTATTDLQSTLGIDPNATVTWKPITISDNAKYDGEEYKTLTASNNAVPAPAYRASDGKYKYVSDNDAVSDDQNYDDIVEIINDTTIKAVMPGYQYLEGTINYNADGTGSKSGTTKIYVLVHVTDLGTDATATVKYTGSSEKDPIIAAPGDTVTPSLTYYINDYQITDAASCDYTLGDDYLKYEIQKMNASYTSSDNNWKSLSDVTVSGKSIKLAGGLKDGDMYRVKISPVCRYSSTTSKINAKEGWVYIKVLNVDTTKLTVDLQDEAEKDGSNVFLFRNSDTTEVTITSIKVDGKAASTSTEEALLAKYPITVESSAATVATATISSNNKKVIDITPKSVGTATVTIKAGTQEVGTINVHVLGVKNDGTLLTTYGTNKSYKTDYETTLLKLDNSDEKDSLTLTLTDGTTDYTSTSDLAWKVSENNDMLDIAGNKITIKNAASNNENIEIGVTLSASVKVGDDTVTYKPTTKALVHVKVVEPGVKLAPSFATIEDNKAKAFSGNKYPATEVYLKSGLELKDWSEYNYSDIELSYKLTDTKGTNATEITDPSLIKLVPRTPALIEDRQSVDYEQIVAGRVGTYYVTITAKDSNGTVLFVYKDFEIKIEEPSKAQTVVLNNSSFTDENDNVGYKAAATTATDNNIRVITNLVPTGYDRKKGEFTGFTATPTLGNIIQDASVKKSEVYGQGQFTEGWTFKAGADTLVSDVTKNQKVTATIPLVYTNVEGATVKNTSGGEITADLTFLINTIEEVKIESDREQSVRKGDTAYFEVSRKFVSTNTNVNSLAGYIGDYGYWVDYYLQNSKKDALFSYTANSEYIKSVTAGYYGYTVVTQDRVGENIPITLSEPGFTNRVTLNLLSQKTSISTFTITTGSTVTSNNGTIDGITATNTKVGRNYDANGNTASTIGDGKWYVNYNDETVVENNRILTLGAWVPLYDVSGNDKFVTGIRLQTSDSSVVKVGSTTMTLSENNLGYQLGTITPVTDGKIEGYGLFTAQVVLQGTGEATITMTALDTTDATKVEIPLVVVSSVPTLKAATFNSNVGVGTVKYAFDGGAYEFGTSTFTVEGELSDKVKVESYANGNIVLSATKTLANDDYDLIFASTGLTVTTSKSIVTGTKAADALDNAKIGSKLSVQLSAINRVVDNSDFSATAKWAAYNLFYNDIATVNYADGNYAYVQFDANDVDIKDVSIVNSSYYKVVDFDTDTNVAKIQYIGAATESELKKAVKAKAKKVTFSIDASDAGYTKPFTTTATLSVVYTQPKFTIASKSATVYPNLEGVDSTAVNTIASTSEYESDNLDALTVNYGSFSQNPSSTGVISIAATAPMNEKLVVTDGLNWRLGKQKAYSFKYKITVPKTAKLALSKSSITLNTTNSEIGTNVVNVTLAGGTTLPTTETFTFAGANKKSQALLDAETLSFSDEDNGYSVAVALNGSVKNGTYKFKIGTTSVTATAATLTVKVTNKAVTDISWKKSGKIDIINANPNAGILYVTPTLKNISGKVVAAYIGTSAEDEGYTVDEKDPFVVSPVIVDGKIRIWKNPLYTADGNFYDTKTTYSIPLLLEVQDDNGESTLVAAAKPVTFKVTQSKLKAKAVPATATIDRGSSGYVTAVLYGGNYVTAIDEKVSLTPKKTVNGITIDPKDFVFDGEKVTMKVSAASTLGGKNGKAKTYKVQYTLTSTERSATQKPVTVTLKIKVQ